MVDTRLFHPDNGCLLQVLFGLHLLGRPARKRELGEMYGLCDEAIQNAIERLADPAYGLVVAVPSGRWPRYQLSEAGQQLMLPMANPGLPRPTERLTAPSMTPVATGVNTSESGSNRRHGEMQSMQLPVESGQNRIQLLPVLETESGSDRTPPMGLASDSGSNRDQGLVVENSTPAPTGIEENESVSDRAQIADGVALMGLAQNQNQLIKLINSGDATDLPNLYAQTLRAGGVFPNIRRQLVPVLAAEGPAFLPHLLGHVAYAHSGECEQRPGVYVNDVARHRELCPPAWLPDLTLTFAEALALAIQGQTRMLVETCPTPTAPPPNQTTELGPPPTAAEAHWCQVWEAALRQLRMEMPQHTFELWLRDTHLREVQDHQALVAVPTTYARDWLTNQLQSAVNRVLAQLLAPGISVQFQVAVHDLDPG